MGNLQTFKSPAQPHTSGLGVFLGPSPRGGDSRAARCLHRRPERSIAAARETPARAAGEARGNTVLPVTDETLSRKGNFFLSPPPPRAKHNTKLQEACRDKLCFLLLAFARAPGAWVPPSPQPSCLQGANARRGGKAPDRPRLRGQSRLLPAGAAVPRLPQPPGDCFRRNQKSTVAHAEPQEESGLKPESKPAGKGEAASARSGRSGSFANG